MVIIDEKEVNGIVERYFLKDVWKEQFKLNVHLNYYNLN